MSVSGDVSFPRRVEPGRLGPTRGVERPRRGPRPAFEDVPDTDEPERRTILVADPDKATQSFFVETFSKTDIAVLSASTGVQALQTLQRGKVQIAFLHLDLPEMDPFELCRRIRHDLLFACIAALAEKPSVSRLADCRSAGFDDYFAKPLDAAIVTRTVKESFARIERWRSLRSSWIA